MPDITPQFLSTPSPERDAWIAEQIRLAEAATPGPWTLSEMSDGKPETVEWEDGTTHEFEPQYFKHVDGVQVFSAAYYIPELESLGNYECSAIEKPNADLVISASAHYLSLLRAVKAMGQVEYEYRWRCGLTDGPATTKEMALEWSPESGLIERRTKAGAWERVEEKIAAGEPLPEQERN